MQAQEERCHCGQQQAADDRASSGAFCSPPSPRPSAIAHADDHGQRGHQHRPQAHKAGIQRGAPRVPHQFFHLLARKTYNQDGVGRGHAMHMMAPVSAGTLSRVLVRNRNHTIPASAAGSAEMIRNGSSQDWKLTTMSR